MDKPGFRDVDCCVLNRTICEGSFQKREKGKRIRVIFWDQFKDLWIIGFDFVVVALDEVIL